MTTNTVPRWWWWAHTALQEQDAIERIRADPRWYLLLSENGEQYAIWQAMKAEGRR